MGPNAVLIAEELMSNHSFPSSNARICDLGCGKGLTSLFLAEQTNAHIYACDLWISQEENSERSEALGFSDSITAVNSAAFELPFEEGFFDALVSIDSYHYFGREEGAIDKIAHFVKPGGSILLALPGLKHEITPADMNIFRHSWNEEAMDTIRPLAWWAELLGKSRAIELICLKEMNCHTQAWAEWLASNNEYAQSDRAAMEAGAGKLMNMIAVELKRC